MFVNSASPFATIEIFRTPAQAAPAWAKLEAASPATVYQTFGFATAWYATLGRDLGFTPLVVVARDASDAPAALLALAERRMGPARLASFAGAKDSNANLPLVRGDLSPTAADYAGLLGEAGRLAGVDAFALFNQPRVFVGRINPLTQLPSQDSPGRGHLASLGPDGETLLASRLSKDSRKKYRKKETRLSQDAPLNVVAGDEPAQAARILDAFFAQKLARFEEKNIASTFERAAARDFLAAGARAGVIRLYGLEWNGRIIAVYGGGAQGGRFSAMFNSFDGDEEIAKSSPGDLLLFALIKRLCAEGCDTLDLGIGEARYKEAVCDRDEALADTFFAVSALGAATRLTLSAAMKAKAVVKSNARLTDLANRAKSLLR